MVGSHETGNETYIRGLVGGFSKLQSDYSLYVYHVGGAWAKHDARVEFQPIVHPNPVVRLTIGLATLAIRDKLDILHVTYTAPLWTPCPIVLTVHDISYVEHPEWFSRRDLRVLSRMVPASIQRAHTVITVSELCRAQIIDYYGVAPEKVVAIPNAAGPAATVLSAEAARKELAALNLDPNRPYVLAVGNLQPRKNLIRLISAFRGVVAAGHDIDLVIAGPEHYRSEDVQAAAAEAKERVRFTGYLSDRQLAACYSRATVFAFPSLFEGFGIPLLEAMAHGVPVVSSRAGALPVVGGDAVLYFDPLDIDSIAGALARAVTDSKLREELILKGRQQEARFTWTESAQQTLNVYRQAARRARVRKTAQD
jgi:glycosyltransferase involved in cell wall biosynthesis